MEALSINFALKVNDVNNESTHKIHVIILNEGKTCLFENKSA